MPTEVVSQAEAHSVEKVEIIEEKVPWTFETLVPYLAVKHGQNEALARSIIHCESHTDRNAVGSNYHDEVRYDEEGEPYTVKVIWSQDHGYWQINDYYNEASARARGFDIYVWEENLEWGFIMLKENGVGPWSASEYCWSPV